MVGSGETESRPRQGECLVVGDDGGDDPTSETKGPFPQSPLELNTLCRGEKYFLLERSRSARPVHVGP